MIPNFRAWYDNKMWYVAKLDLWGDPSQTTCDLAPFFPKYEELFDVYLSEVVLMQSTGLKDKNGVEIFEGDIVVIKYSEHGLDYYEKIVFENGTFTAGDEDWLYNIKDYCVVCGNIYENPELLEVKP